ncbi:MAG TPA: condensation domain-containing protein, partial [Acidobacteriota bacterium]|nr:condensation domain-containing protein [Acidobacteriota bacterium]
MGSDVPDIANLTPEQRRALLKKLLEIQTRPRTEISPLAHGQRALWFLHQLAPDSSAYHVISALRIISPVNPAALRQSFQKLVDRHPVLRSTFEIHDTDPVQIIHPHQIVHFTEIEAATWSENDLERQVRQAAHHPFELSQGPLLRVSLYHRSESDHL